MSFVRGGVNPSGNGANRYYMLLQTSVSYCKLCESKNGKNIHFHMSIKDNNFKLS